MEWFCYACLCHFHDKVCSSAVLQFPLRNSNGCYSLIQKLNVAEMNSTWVTANSKFTFQAENFAITAPTRSRQIGVVRFFPAELGTSISEKPCSNSPWPTRKLRWHFAWVEQCSIIRENTKENEGKEERIEWHEQSGPLNWNCSHQETRKKSLHQRWKSLSLEVFSLASKFFIALDLSEYLTKPHEEWKAQFYKSAFFTFAVETAFTTRKP